MGLQPGKATNDPNAYLAFAKQSAKGTEGTTFHFVKQMDGSAFEVDRDIERVREGGDGQEVGFSYVKMVKADGDLGANARPRITGQIFAAVNGADAVSSAAVPSLARHTSSNTASLPYFTFEERWSDEIERMVDGVWTGFELEGEAGKPWTLKANYISGGSVYQRDVASTLTPTRESGKPYMYPFGSYIFDGGASYAADFTKIKMAVKRSVDDGIQTTGLGRDDVIPLAYDVDVEGTLKYTSRAFYQKIKYNGGSVVISDLATGSVDLAQHQLIQIASGVVATGLMRAVAPNIEWLDAKVNKLDPDGKTVYLDVVGASVKGSTYAFWSVVDNTDLSAY